MMHDRSETLGERENGEEAIKGETTENDRDMEREKGGNKTCVHLWRQRQESLVAFVTRTRYSVSYACKNHEIWERKQGAQRKDKKNAARFGEFQTS